MKYTKFFAALVLSIAAAVPAIAQVPLVYTSQPRDVTPLTGAKMSGQPIQVDEGSNWQWKMDAGRFYTYTESDLVIDWQDGRKEKIFDCTGKARICAAQSATVSHDAKWIVFQVGHGSQFQSIRALYTDKNIQDRRFNVTSTEHCAYHIPTKELRQLTQGYHDLTPKFCGDRLLWAAGNRSNIWPPYAEPNRNFYQQKVVQIHSADWDGNIGALSNIKNLTPHEMLTMSPECLHDGSILYSSWQGYSKRATMTSTPQNMWWVQVIDGNGSNALTIASLGAHNSAYIPTRNTILDEIGPKDMSPSVSKMLILRPARQVAIKDGRPYICAGNYYRTNHVGGGGELLCYSQTQVEGVSKRDSWLYRESASSLEGSAAFVPFDLQSLTPWGHGFDNPQRFDKEGRVMGKANYASPYPGGELMFTWFKGACYEPMLGQAPLGEWGKKSYLGGPLCQKVICKTPLAKTSNPHKQCEVLAGDDSLHIWDAHPIVTYNELFGVEKPALAQPDVLGDRTQLRVVDFTEMELTGMPTGDQLQAYKNRIMNQGHATPDVENGRMDKFCVDIIEPWDVPPTTNGYKSRTLYECVTPLEDGSLFMDVPPETLLVMYGIDSTFQFPLDREPTWKECINVIHGLCVVAEDQMLHSLRQGERRTCHGCHDAHGAERHAEVGNKTAEERFYSTMSSQPAGC